MKYDGCTCSNCPLKLDDYVILWHEGPDEVVRVRVQALVRPSPFWIPNKMWVWLASQFLIVRKAAATHV